jgi:DnaJ-class molecular chaperone
MTKKEIIICHGCKGSGKVDKRELEDYHHNTYYEWDEVCPDCNGFGRVMQTIVTYTRKLTKTELKLVPKPKDMRC